MIGNLDLRHAIIEWTYAQAGNVEGEKAVTNHLHALLQMARGMVSMMTSYHKARER